MKEAQSKAPGKLYIAGEYAVTEPGHPAIIVAVDRFIHVTISESTNQWGIIDSPALSDTLLKWKRTNNKLTLVEDLKHADILLSALHITEQFIRESDLSLPFYDITIKSELADETGAKYGLGSSGAVTIATIRALLSSVSLSVSDETVYKLAALAHLSLNSNGSFGDLAAAAYTGWIAYSRFDKEWVKHNMKNYSLIDLIELSWPKLVIEPLSPPPSLELLIGWTGSPASTEKLVGSLKERKQSESYKHFLNESYACVNQLITGFKTNDIELIFEQLTINRHLLLEMSQTNQLVIETPVLKKLCEIAEKHNAPAKTSGAGGGDCGIALVRSSDKNKLITKEWMNNGIIPLSLEVYTKNNS